LKGDGLKRRCSIGKRSNQQGEAGSRDDLPLKKRWSWREHVTRWQSPRFLSRGGQGTWTLLGKGWEWKRGIWKAGRQEKKYWARLCLGLGGGVLNYEPSLTKPSKGEGSHSGLGHQGPQPWLSKGDVNCITFNSLLLFNVCHLWHINDIFVLDHHGLQIITPKTNWSFHSKLWELIPNKMIRLLRWSKVQPKKFMVR
jgi:hypothetical protein